MNKEIEKAIYKDIFDGLNPEAVKDLKKLQKQFKADARKWKIASKKAEEIPVALKLVYKILDFISWDILEEYSYRRKNKEYSKSLVKERRLRAKATKEMADFLDKNKDIAQDLQKIPCPISALVPLNGYGITPPPVFESLKDMREAWKQ